VPYQLTFQDVVVSGDTEVVLAGTKDVRIMAATNTPRIIGISNPGNDVLIAIQNWSGVAVPLVHASGSASLANRKLLMNGLGGDWSLPHGIAVRALSIDPNIDPQVFPDALRGWAVDNRGLEAFARSAVGGATSDPSTSSATFAVLAEMTEQIQVLGGVVEVGFDGSFSLPGGSAGEIQIHVDGDPYGTPRPISYASSQGALDPAPSVVVAVSVGAHVAGLSAGSHTFDLRWRATAGAVTAVGVGRELRVREAR
jgi:hypothetical protein